MLPEWLAVLDPRLQEKLAAEVARGHLAPAEPLPRARTVVLAGHRASGKSSLLPFVATALGRPGVDLDAELERTTGRPLRDWVRGDQPGFRRAERALFESLPQGALVAVGGGFLAHHAQVLQHAVVVLLPLSFETYAERLRADVTRPRLRPDLPLEQELSQVFEEREALHQKVPTLGVPELFRRAHAGHRSARVVTLPPDAEPRDFAFRAKRAGAEWLEVRSDLHPQSLVLTHAAPVLPLLVAERGVALGPRWLELASLVDREGPGGSLRSFHAPAPLEPQAALAHWEANPPAERAQVKHVEPLGELSQAGRLFETQRLLIERFGAERVTVLATGPLALPFRALLSRRNALEYLAFDETFAAAPGQRLLRDATREHRAGSPPRLRLGIVGHPVHRSKSPAIHRQPFDRLDLPPDTELRALFEVLHPHYAGFAVTSPFKAAAARVVGAELDAVNTLARTATGWSSQNTDVEGAAAALEKLAASEVTVLGDGGAAVAVRLAAQRLGVRVKVLNRRLAGHVDSAAVWTWPPHVAPPEALRFSGSRVAVIAYGANARAVASQVRAKGGVPVFTGARWFVTQARAQAKIWEAARR